MARCMHCDRRGSAQKQVNCGMVSERRNHLPPPTIESRMNHDNACPTIFLAFANDRTDGIGYLRNLPDEARRIHAALESVRTAGLCEVVVRQNATLEDILAVFQHSAYRNRIALFHYAGHANGFQLLLESAAGKTAAAAADGLAAFLAQQRALELIFLNGCSTQPQVQELLDAGIATVIATSQAIDDAVATRFAEGFYQSLAGSATLRQAYNEAVAILRTMHGDNTRHFYLQSMDGAQPTTQPQYSRLPWMLYTRAGAEVTEQWSLPKAANDPLFGLPPLPVLDLPEIPFRHLAWFRRTDAPIFFGRGHQIRELYSRISDGTGAPIILFYGQSGVGKSSLLAAGLLPRLEATHTVRYQRRERESGILGALAAALGLSGSEPTADQLCDAWLGLEAEDQQPVVLLLDQVEEIFTRPVPTNPDELPQLLLVLQVLLGEKRDRPQGKLVLAFRKEWLAEIEKHFAEAKLPRARFFLERLDRPGVIEAIEGATRDQRLVDYYGLTVQEGLAEEIADDLLADRGATVAPTLQILLSKLWERARACNYSAPCFDQDLYQELRHQGLLLGDFLDQQLVSLHEQYSVAVDSGLALDLLAFHTTSLGTAEQRTLTELRELYRHQDGILAGLLRTCQDLYLLTDPSANRPGGEPTSRLAHDTLAPLVRARFDESDAPGQRARRILESRAVDWQEGQQGTPLDEADLAMVEAGLANMRALTIDEKRLVTASQVDRKRREKERRHIAQELATAQARELAQEKRANQWLRAVVGILTIIMLTLLIIVYRPTYVAWQTKSPVIHIAAGTAIVGTNDVDAQPEEKPEVRIALDDYFIEQFEVNNYQYQRCVDVGVCDDLPNALTTDNPDYQAYPVTNVTAIQAAKYCQWIGRRLPTELEWERAARGSTGMLWPWGSEPVSAERVHMQLAENWLDEPIAVNERPLGKSREGEIYNLIGNAWEWTSSYSGQTYVDYDVTHVWDGEVSSLAFGDALVLRGGGWSSGIFAVTNKNRSSPERTSNETGVRCANDG